MARVDGALQWLLWEYVLPLIGIVIALRLFRRQIYAFLHACNTIKTNAIAGSYSDILWKRKQRLFAALEDLANGLNRPLVLLEIGPSCGQNFQLYPSGTDVLCLDSNPSYTRYIRRGAEDNPHVKLVEHLVTSPEEPFPVDSCSVDAVVCTGCLLNCRDVSACLREIYRVLNLVITLRPNVTCNADTIYITYSARPLVRTTSITLL